MKFKYCLLTLFTALGTTFVFGSSPSKTIQPGLIQLVQSDDFINLELEAGKSVSLPRYKVISADIPHSISAISFDEKFANDSCTSKELKNQLALQDEVQQLSKKLGINITDTQYINLYRETAEWLGTRYLRGGMSRKAVDCSGFANLIYKAVYNKKLPRVSRAIANTVKESVPIDKLIPGDLVFFSTFGKKYINHVGVYLGDGHFVHASIKGGVKVSPLTEGYYRNVLKKAGPVISNEE